ncbi:hypothetical protein HW555_007031 [Spodoptera exigua]|uniref:Uncharacterized protein n=1 Tax=Spodoptera exigua TaxID=7107 RepID=A0A835L312_SPOEX|nr:hypothetical protein HW555_007031 [Spodoptera exigua]
MWAETVAFSGGKLRVGSYWVLYCGTWHIMMRLCMSIFPLASMLLTQVLTGHYCFGEHLDKVRRDATANYHHCEGLLDSSQHKLE